MEDLDLLIDDEHHSLLEPVTPAYSNVTVRRAFIVWMCCGQTNLFKDVCNYYHYLEALEEQLPPEKRAISRRYEFDLISNKPPMSPFLLATFPKLYSQNQKHINLAKTVEEITNDTKTIKIEETKESEITRQNGATTEEILAASQMIRNHCKNNSVSLKNFMAEYKKYSEKCDLKNTVNNVAYYIKRKMIHDELILIANTPKNFSFLNSSTQETKEHKSGKSAMNKTNIDYYEYLVDRENKENVFNKVPKGMRKISKSHESLNSVDASKPFSNKSAQNNIKLLKSKPNDMSNITYFDLNEDLKKLQFGGQNNTNMTLLRNDKK